jgi:hypothetical protein
MKSQLKGVLKKKTPLKKAITYLTSKNKIYKNEIPSNRS